jgi:hypothetical protein
MLDNVMNSWTQRSECDEGEEACDIYTRQQWEGDVEEERKRSRWKRSR